MKQQDGTFFVFSLDGRLFGLPVSAIRQVVLAVDITPVQGAPAPILGLIDIHGQILPVIDMRAKYGFPTRETAPEDRFAILDFQRESLAIRIDDVRDVLDIPETDILSPEGIMGPLPGLVGFFRHPEGIVLLYEPDIIFSAEFEIMAALDRPSPV